MTGLDIRADDQQPAPGDDGDFDSPSSDDLTRVARLRARLVQAVNSGASSRSGSGDEDPREPPGSAR